MCICWSELFEVSEINRPINQTCFCEDGPGFMKWEPMHKKDFFWIQITAISSLRGRDLCNIWCLFTSFHMLAIKVTSVQVMAGKVWDCYQEKMRGRKFNVYTQQPTNLRFYFWRLINQCPRQVLMNECRLAMLPLQDWSRYSRLKLGTTSWSAVAMSIYCTKWTVCVLTTLLLPRYAQICSSVTRQLVELESCSDPLKMRQVN